MDRIDNNRHLQFFTRKAESSDTHDQIQRHDPDYHKNKKQNKRDDFEDHDEDDAFISIASIIIFLEGLKKDQSNMDLTDTKPIDNKMKAAMSAYGKTPPKPEKRFTYLDNDEQDVDQTMVQNLINTLNEFQSQGFDNMRLIPAKGFLQSIQTTVEKIQSFEG